MRNKKNAVMAANLGIYILGCVLACVLSKTGEYVFSGFVLIMLAAGEYLSLIHI